MERDLADNRRQSYSTGRCLSSPFSCLIHTETEYARISNHNTKTRPSPKLRDLMRRLLLVRSCGLENNKSKTLVTSHYDAVSYSQNFDDGFYFRDDDPKVPIWSHRTGKASVLRFLNLFTRKNIRLPSRIPVASFATLASIINLMFKYISNLIMSLFFSLLAQILIRDRQELQAIYFNSSPLFIQLTEHRFKAERDSLASILFLEQFSFFSSFFHCRDSNLVASSSVSAITSCSFV
ncbi:unnamed protein product [Arabidopsis halleri]